MRIGLMRKGVRGIVRGSEARSSEIRMQYHGVTAQNTEDRAV